MKLLRVGIGLQPKVSSGGAYVPSPPPGALWSDPATWASTHGHVPIAGDIVVLEEGQTVYLDEPTAALDQLHIMGTLIALPGATVGVTSNLIMVMDGGRLEVGTEGSPFTGNIAFTLTGPRSTHTTRSEDNALDNDGLTRAIMVEDGGQIVLQGNVPALLWTKLNAHASPAATSFILADAVAWAAGAQVAIGLTDFYAIGATEQLTLAGSTSGAAMSTTAGLSTFRWGLLQYPCDTPVSGNHMSLTQGTFTRPSVLTPTHLDERAEVVNLSRNIVIQGANDSDWSTHGFGVHVMVMGRNSVAQVKGVEFRRCGQRRAMGRYPFHWHMLSYTPYISGVQAGGTFLGDVVPGNHYLKDCSIWGSENRAVVVHGTCGVVVDNVYAVDIKGHAFFMEDGSERRNTITNCIAMKVRDPGATDRLKLHDELAGGFWITNPDNTITNNRASDCVGRGLWNSFAAACFGLSRNVAIAPNTLEILLYQNNVGHSCRNQGLATNFIVTDEAGTAIGEDTYLADLTKTFTMTANQMWKCGRDGSGFEGVGGYRNRVGAARYIGWTAADNDSVDFAGVTHQQLPTGPADQPALMEGTLLIGTSLNNANPPIGVRVGLSSYHHELSFRKMVFVNYPFVAGVQSGANVQGGGAIALSDMYVHVISLGFYRNTDWVFLNASPGFLTPAPYFDGFPLLYSTGPNRYRYWSVAGAIWDPQGYWGPAGNYLLPSTDAFFSHGLSSSTALEGGANGLTTPDKFFGLSNIILDTEDGDGYGRSLLTLKCRRFNSSMVEVGEHTIGDPDESALFPGMRHFTVAKGGRYLVEFPDGELADETLSCAISNAPSSGDSVLIGLPWDGDIPVHVRIDSGYYGSLSEGDMIAAGRCRVLDPSGTSIADVLADTTGETCWQDTANDVVWILYVGGLADGTGGAEVGSDFWLAQTAFVRLSEEVPPGPADGVGLLLNGTTDSLSLSSGLFNANGPYTVCWHGYVSSTASFPNLFVVGSAFNACDTVQLTGGTIDAYVFAGGLGNASGGSLTVGTRVHIAFRRTSATNFDVLVNGAVVTSVTRDVSGRAATSFLRIGADWGNNSGSHVSGGLWEVRMWNTNLSDGEIAAEAASATVVRTANLFGEYSFVHLAVGTDESGNGHTLTVNGTPSEIPPV